MESKPAGDFRFRPVPKVRLLVLLSFFAGLSETVLAAPDVEGQWGSRINFTTVPISAAVLPNGKLLIFSSWDRFDFESGTGARNKTYANLFDPATGQVTEFLVTQTNHDMFCPGTAFLEDGRLLVNGGGPFVTTTSIYNFSGNQWVGGASMSRRRWYNASTTLPGGGVFTLGGIPDDGVGELWTAGGGWSVLAGAPVTPMTMDAGSYMPRSEQHPRLLVAPSGKLFAAGPTPNMQWYDTAGGGSVQSAGRRSDDIYAQNNVTVMFDVGKILTAGGSPRYNEAAGAGPPASANAYVIDINGAVSTRKIASMRHGRTYANGVVLPDGRVLVVGGKGDGKAFSDAAAVFVPEMFDPDTETWTPMATQATPRTYHSTAVMLPDGRVFSGGGGLCGNCGVNHADGEIYSPPYLFQGPRPVITGAPTVVAYDTSFSVATTGNVDRFTFVRLSSATHTVNTDQRFLPLASTPAGGGSFTVTSPRNANIAPPGYYMLFALSATGVPSVSKIMKLSGAPVGGGGFRYVKLEEVSEVTGKAFGSAAELNVLNTSGTTIGRTGWVASADSAETSSPGYPAAKAIDGHPATIWHTQFVGASPPPPHWLVVDMGTSHPVGGFRYLPRQDSSSNGRIGGYRFYVSTDGVSWGTPVAQGTFANTPAEKTVTFGAPPPPSNQPPVVTNPGNQSSVVGQSVNLAIGASDPNGDTLSYSATGLPAGLSINAGTGVITGTVSTAGASSVTVTVSDGKGGTTPTSFTWTVTSGSTGGSFRYVRLEEVSEVTGKAFGSAAELNLLNTSGTTIGRTGWVASADSAETSSPGYPAAKAIDGNPATMWHTQFVGASPPPPHWLVVDMGTSHPVGGFRYLPRQDSSSNGRIGGYRFYVSTDGVNWGTPVAQGTFANTPAEKTVTFSAAPGAAPANQSPVVSTAGSQEALALDPIASPPQTAGTPVSYTAVPHGGVNPRFSWSFGDGTAATAPATTSGATHTFAQPGRYTVTVTVTATNNVGARVVREFVQAGAPSLDGNAADGIDKHRL